MRFEMRQRYLELQILLANSSKPCEISLYDGTKRKGLYVSSNVESSLVQVTTITFNSLIHK